MKTKIRVKAQGREMTDATCEFISLVPRGANQIPFRIIKRDKSQENSTMIQLNDLKGLLARKAVKKEPEAPVITAVVVEKSADPAKIAPVLEASGLSIKTVVEKAEEGLTVYLQNEQGTVDAIEKDTLVSISDGVMVAIKGFSVWGSDEKLASFADKVQAMGFFAGLDNALCVLRDVLYDEAYDVDSRDQTFTDIGQACDQFKAYVMTLLDQVPAQAFKTQKALKAVSTHNKQGARDVNADGAVSADGQSKALSVDDTNVNDHVHGQSDDTQPANLAVVTDVVDVKAKKAELQEQLEVALKAGDDAKATEVMTALKAVIMQAPVVQPDDGDVAQGDPAEGKTTGPTVSLPTAVNKGENGGELPSTVVDASATAKEDAVVEALKGQLTQLADAMTGLTAMVTKMQETQTAQATQIATMAQKAENTERTIKGAVIGSSSNVVEHPASVSTTQEAARKSERQVIDTAYGGKF